MHKKRDYYNILGVTPQTTSEELKRAFKKRAKEIHPDKNNNTEDSNLQFQLLKEAYTQLLGQAATQSSISGLFQDPNVQASLGEFLSSNNVDLQNLSHTKLSGDFSKDKASTGSLNYNRTLHAKIPIQTNFTLFSRQDQQQREQAQPVQAEKKAPAPLIQHLRATVPLNWQESFYGCTKTIVFNYNVKCRDHLGLQCSKCDGSKLIPTTSSCSIDIPQGCQNLYTIIHRIDETMDISFTTSVEPHPYYSRRGNDAFASIKVPYVTALLGAQLEIPSVPEPKEKIPVTIPRFSGHQFTIRIPAQGFFLNATTENRGDLILMIQVNFPLNLSPEEETLLKQIQNLPIYGKDRFEFD